VHTLKTWEFIEASDTVVTGFTEDNYPYWELTVVGYNDFDDLSDLETIATVRGIQKQTDVEYTYSFAVEEARSHSTVLIRIDEAVEDIRDMIEG
jgi:hypothetical protein